MSALPAGSRTRMWNRYEHRARRVAHQRSRWRAIATVVPAAGSCKRGGADCRPADKIYRPPHDDVIGVRSPTTVIVFPAR